MSDQVAPVVAGVGVGGVGVGVSLADLSGVGAASEVASTVGAGVAEAGGAGAVGEVVSVGIGAAIIGFFSEVVGLLGALLSGVLGFLGEVVAGVIIGGAIVGAVGSLFLLVGVIVVGIGQRRVAQVPEHLRAIPALAPRVLRWVCGLLPGGEGAAWLAEVTSCLAETADPGEQRRYVRSYRRNVLQLIWTSWTEHLRASRRRKLS